MATVDAGNSMETEKINVFLRSKRYLISFIKSRYIFFSACLCINILNLNCVSCVALFILLHLLVILLFPIGLDQLY